MPAQRSATPRLARAINDRLALNLLIEHGSLTAPRLRELTGLSRPTISDILRRLTDAGLIRATGIVHDQHQPGPGARRYAVAPDLAYVAAADLGRTPHTLHVADLGGAVVTEIDLSAVTEPDGTAPGLEEALRAAGISALHTVVLAVHDAADLTAGCSVAGLLAALRGVGNPAVIVESAARAAAVAETHTDGSRTFALLWLGRQVDLAVVLDGQLHRGVSGAAGTLGALRLGTVPAKDLLGAAAVRNLAHRYGLPGGELVTDAGAGGRGSAVVLAGLVAHTASLAAALTAVLDPGRILLGGELALAGGEAFAVLVRGRLTDLTPVPVEVRPTEAGPDAARDGALLIALEALRAEMWPSSRAEHVTRARGSADDPTASAYDRRTP